VVVGAHVGTIANQSHVLSLRQLYWGEAEVSTGRHADGRPGTLRCVHVSGRMCTLGFGVAPR
jgi:hypothetical protein